MTEQTIRLGTRVLRALSGSSAPRAVLAGAAAGLGAYRVLHARPSGIRVTLALTVAGLTAAGADRHARRHPGRREPGTERRTAPSPPLRASASARLTADALAHAAVQAASDAHALDRGGGALTRPGNWQGLEDGSATFELTPTAHLRYSPADRGSGLPGDHGHDRPHRYELLVEHERPVVVTTVTQLAGLLRRHTAGRPLDGGDPVVPGALPRPRHRHHRRLGQGRPLRPAPRPACRSQADGPR